MSEEAIKEVTVGPDERVELSVGPYSDKNPTPIFKLRVSPQYKKPLVRRNRKKLGLPASFILVFSIHNQDDEPVSVELVKLSD